MAVEQPFEILTARDPSAQEDRRICLEIGTTDPLTKIADANGFGYKSWDGTTRYAYITDGMHWAVYTLPKTVPMHEVIAIVPKLDVVTPTGDQLLISLAESRLDGDVEFGVERLVQSDHATGGSKRYQSLGNAKQFDFWWTGGQSRYCKVVNRRQPVILRVRHYEDDAGKWADTTTLMLPSWTPKDVATYKLDAIRLTWERTDVVHLRGRSFDYIPIVAADGKRYLMRVLPSMSIELRTWAPPGSTAYESRLADHVTCMGPQGNLLEIRIVSQATSRASVNLFSFTDDLFETP